MKIEQIDTNIYRLSFDDSEVISLQSDSKGNELTIIEMLEMVLGILFISGYAHIVGKES